jgi:hypothetical protein
LQQISKRLLAFRLYRQVVLILYRQRIVGQEMKEVLGFKHHFVRADNTFLKGERRKESKVCSTVSEPVELSLNTTPHPAGAQGPLIVPPTSVVP